MTAWPNQHEGDYVLKDYVFASGETLPELRMHYPTLGTPQRNAAGEIDNAVLLLHGTSGTGKNWLLPSLADELFGAGQPLDAAALFHHHARRHRRRRLQQAERRAAREVSALPLSRHRRVEHRLVTEHSASGICVWCSAARWAACMTWMWGEMYPGLDGRAGADREPAGRDLRPQLDLSAASPSRRSATIPE